MYVCMYVCMYIRMHHTYIYIYIYIASPDLVADSDRAFALIAYVLSQNPVIFVSAPCLDVKICHEERPTRPSAHQHPSIATQHAALAGRAMGAQLDVLRCVHQTAGFCAHSLARLQMHAQDMTFTAIYAFGWKLSGNGHYPERSERVECSGTFVHGSSPAYTRARTGPKSSQSAGAL